jgi:kynurenine formamidase
MRFGLTILLTCLVGGAALADGATQPTPPAPTPSLSLADAFALIRAKPKIDLTHEFSPATPVWSGFGQAKETPAVDPHTLEAYTIAKDGFRATFYALVGQYGTHVDPPAHFSPTGRTMDEIPLDDMILPLVVLDDTPFLQADPAHAFSVADLEAWEKLHGQVPKGAFAALRTDMSKDWATNPERFKRTPFPGWTLAVLKVLFEQRGVTAIGHEGLDTDATPSMESETYVLSNGHYQIEVMTNLDKVPPTGAFILATWPKPKGGLGFPARVFAVLP